MKPTLEDIRTARASARQRRDTNAKRLKRIILKLMTRVEAYEHELSLLSKVERDVIANGTSADLFQLRTETRFDGGVPKTATITPENAQEATSAVRRATPMPSSGGPLWEMEPLHSTPANPHGERSTYPIYAAGEVF